MAQNSLTMALDQRAILIAEPCKVFLSSEVLTVMVTKITVTNFLIFYYLKIHLSRHHLFSLSKSIWKNFQISIHPLELQQSPISIRLGRHNGQQMVLLGSGGGQPYASTSCHAKFTTQESKISQKAFKRDTGNLLS